MDQSATFPFLLVDRPRGWLRRVNRAETAAELDALHLCMARGRPFGGAEWAKRTARRLGLENTFRSRGRPRKKKPGDKA